MVWYSGVLMVGSWFGMQGAGSWVVLLGGWPKGTKE